MVIILKYIDIILAVVLFDYETRSLVLRLRVFENRTLRRIFGPRMNENVDWRRFHNEDLHSLHRSSNIVWRVKSRILRCTGHAAWMKDGRSVLKIVTGKSIRKRSLVRLRRRYENNIINRCEYKVLNWFSSELGLLEGPCVCGMAPPSFVSHGVI